MFKSLSQQQRYMGSISSAHSEAHSRFRVFFMSTVNNFTGM